VKFEVRDGLGVKQAVVFVINENGRVYQVHKVVFGSKPVAKIIEIRENDVVVEYGTKYDLLTKKTMHLLHVLYYPETMKYEEAVNRAKAVVSSYLRKQIEMGARL